MSIKNLTYFNTPNEFSDVKISLKNENGKNSYGHQRWDLLESGAVH